MQPSDISVFSRKIEVASISTRLAEHQIEASPAEREALAAVLALQAIDRLVARLTLRRLRSGLIEVKGRVESDVVQTCVVTLEPVPARVVESFQMTFGDGAPEPDLTEIDIDFADSDPPEPIFDDKIDLGAIAAEQVSLGLDPYPRQAGAKLPPEHELDGADIAPDNELISRRKPFLELDKLKK